MRPASVAKRSAKSLVGLRRRTCRFLPCVGMTGANKDTMNFRNALGFFMVGALFALVPRLAPSLCPFTGVDGSSTRMIWLQIMSTLLLGIGLSYFARRSIIGLASLLEYT